jgi:hypothetical protein
VQWLAFIAGPTSVDHRQPAYRHPREGDKLETTLREDSDFVWLLEALEDDVDHIGASSFGAYCSLKVGESAASQRLLALAIHCALCRAMPARSRQSRQHR